MKKKTLQQNSYVLNQLLNYSLERGKIHTHELDADFLEKFIVAGFTTIKLTTLATYVNKLRSFLGAAQTREWIHRPMLLKQLERVPAVYDEKEPYTDEELKLIWAEAKEMNGGTRGYAKYPKTFVLLLDFMLETNLRVGDAATLTQLV